MSDLFRCDYCGQYRPLADARIYHVHDYTNGDGDDVYTPSRSAAATTAPARSPAPRLG